MAPRHIGQGSHVVYRSQPESWKSPSLWQAARIATTSACAVGSFVAVTRLTPSATIWPSFTIIAAKGPPAPVRTFSIPKAIARRMNSFIIRDSSRFRVPLPPANININVPFPCIRRMARICGGGALQSLEIYELCAALQRDRSLLCPKRTRIAMENRQIGKSVLRKEGREKVTGSARYVD